MQTLNALTLLFVQPVAKGVYAHSQVLSQQCSFFHPNTAHKLTVPLFSYYLLQQCSNMAIMHDSKCGLSKSFTLTLAGFHFSLLVLFP